MPMYGFYVPHERVFAPQDDTMVTKQEFKTECDIYSILKQYQKTGVITHITKQQPVFEDLPDDVDFQHSLAVISHAEEAFAALPASVRDSFQNDPGRLLAAINDPRQREHLIELGIIKAPPAPRPPDPQAAPSTSTNNNVSG